jgi:pyruvate,water dikinase
LEVDLDGLDAAVAQVVDSARTERALDYAERIGSEGSGIKMAVIAQRLVEAEFAGVVNTSVPVDGGLGVEIEIVRGLGDKLVDGSVTPARFLVGRDGGVAHVSGEPRVDDELVAELAALASRLEQFFGRPQDVEFAVEGGEVFVVQSRPLTGPQGAATAAAAPLDGDYAEVVTGLSGYVAERVTGKVVKPARPGDAQTVEPGSVLVLAAATPIWDSVIFQSSALVTDEGGSTSHAIRVANELGIPAVVGARVATAMLEEGETVLVDTISGTNVGRVLRQSPDGK